MPPKAAAGESVIRPAILDDDASFLELLLIRPDLLGDDVVIFADGRGWGGAGTGWPLAVGWRRAGGPVILGATTGAATEALLIEPLQLAGVSASWSLPEWDDAIRAWWAAAAPELRERVAERWKLPEADPWGVATWTRAAWGVPPRSGRAAIGIVATRVPPPLQSAIEWLAAGEAALAYRIRWYGAEASAVPRLEPVAGSWGTPAAFTGPSAVRELEVKPVREPVAKSDRPEQIVAAIETLGREIGCAISANSGWIRIAGARRSLRIFPGPAWVDFQLVGLDEGTLIGLGYRYGIPLSLEPPPGAPPGAHLRVTGSELEPPLRAMVRMWLEEPPAAAVSPAGPPRDPKPAPQKPRKPRNPRRRPPS